MVLYPRASPGPFFRGKPRGIKPNLSSAEAEREGGLKNLPPIVSLNYEKRKQDFPSYYFTFEPFYLTSLLQERKSATFVYNTKLHLDNG